MLLLSCIGFLLPSLALWMDRSLPGCGGVTPARPIRASLTYIRAFSHPHAPDASARADSKPLASFVVGHARHPSKVAHLVLALPASCRAADAVRLRCPIGLLLAHEIPNQYLAIISSRCELAPPRGRPVYTVDSAAVSPQLQQCLARLSCVQYADDIRVLGECCE